MTSQTQLLIVMTVIALIAVPLIFKWVPPNRFYGFRTARTLSDTGLWYSANQFCGWAILIACAVSIILLVVIPFSSVPITLTEGLAPVLIILAPILIAVAASFFYLGRAGRLAP
ncbi:MAG: SdpI family protein [Pseudomonadota bacterium]